MKIDGNRLRLEIERAVQKHKEKTGERLTKQEFLFANGMNYQYVMRACREGFIGNNIRNRLIIAGVDVNASLID